HVLLFPVVRMESLLKYLNTIKALFIVGPTTGKYVYAKCQLFYKIFPIAKTPLNPFPYRDIFHRKINCQTGLATL
ncbi:MAG: hypothetical protein DRG50_08305, partial [Deltaproteobacteria bacterium]